MRNEDKATEGSQMVSLRCFWVVKNIGSILKKT